MLQGGKADHDFGKAVLKQIPEAIKNPVAVIASKSHSDTSTVAILDMQYNENQSYVRLLSTATDSKIIK